MSSTSGYCLCLEVSRAKPRNILLGSVQRKCHCCETPVWLAPTSIKKEKDLTLICFQCFSFLRKADPSIATSFGDWMPGQKKEIAKIYGPERLFCALCKREFKTPIDALTRSCNCL